MSDVHAWDKKYHTDAAEIARRTSAVENGLDSSTLPEVLRFEKENARVLELGTGTGQHAAAVANARPQWRVTAVDFSPRAIEEACALSASIGVSLEVVRADITHLPFPDNAFDVVFGDHVIGHIAEPACAIAECARVLAPGGVLILNAGNMLRPDGWPLHQLVSQKAYLQRSFFPWELADLMRHAGLRCVRSYGSLILLDRGWKVLFRRTKQHLAQEGRIGDVSVPVRSRSTIKRSIKKFLEQALPSYMKVQYGIVACKPV